VIRIGRRFDREIIYKGRIHVAVDRRAVGMPPRKVEVNVTRPRQVQTTAEIVADGNRRARDRPLDFEAGLLRVRIYIVGRQMAGWWKAEAGPDAELCQVIIRDGSVADDALGQERLVNIR